MQKGGGGGGGVQLSELESECSERLYKTSIHLRLCHLFLPALPISLFITHQNNRISFTYESHYQQFNPITSSLIYDDFA